MFPDGPQDINVTPEDIASAVAEEEAALSEKPEDTPRDPIILRDLMLDKEEAMSRPGSSRGFARQVKKKGGAGTGVSTPGH